MKGWKLQVKSLEKDLNSKFLNRARRGTAQIV
jgi:hypothetical protein